MSKKFHFPSRVSGSIYRLLEIFRRQSSGFHAKPKFAWVFLSVSFLFASGMALQAQNPACEPCEISKEVILPVPPRASFTSIPKNRTIPCSAAPPVSTMLSYSNGANGDCAISGTVTSVIVGSHNECGGSYTETWMFTDECDRTIMRSRVITVLPAPKAHFVSHPKNIAISCEHAPPKVSKLSYTNSSKGGCRITGSVTSTIEGSHDECGGEYTETWIFTDNCDRTIMHSRIITVNPAPPAAFINPPGDTTIACNAAPPTPSSLSYSNGSSGVCSISGSVISTATGSHDECGGSYTETWTFTDRCGRTITHSRTYTVEPAPQATFINPPGDTTIACNAAPPTPSSLSYSNSDAGVCLISGSVLSTINGSHDECGGSYTETWSFTDNCGRNITHIRTYTVTPAPPAAFTSLPGAMTIACSAAPPQPTSLSYTNNETGVCEISGTVMSTIQGSHNECGGSYTETWSFTDNCGRNITHSRTITVNPAPPAAFTSLPGNITIECATETPPSTPLSYTNNDTGVCEISGTVFSVVTLLNAACPTTFTETWIFTDNCGRTITHSRIITVTFFWQNENIGAANGSAQYSCNGPAPGAIGPVSLNSVGFGSSTSDIKHFIYTYLDGDGQIIARLNNVSNQGFAGIMFRETLAPGSKKVSLRRQNNLFNVQREVRSMTNGPEVSQQWPRVHRWLRLDRMGNVFAAYTSPDGVNWWSCPSSTVVAMGQCILVGVFVEGINVNTSSNAIFDYVKVTQGASQPLSAPQPGITFEEEQSRNSDFDLIAGPNPISSGAELNLQLSGVTEGNVRIGLHSMQGALVKEIVIDATHGSTFNLGLNGVPAGVYFIKARTQDGHTVSRKIVVTNK